jgi:hypothetical protein
MTLTQTDLNAIGSLIDQKLENKLKPIENRLGSVETKLNSVEKEVKNIKKDTTYIIGTLDKELMYQTKRIDRIENHQHLLPVAD